MENIIVIFQKVKNRNTKWFSNSASGHTPKRIGSKILKKYLHTIVPNLTIHNSQKAETPQMDEWIYKMWCAQ
jgi:mannitol-1-phosphate/altronate dehydrogenase